jgi:hypothetical protein
MCEVEILCLSPTGHKIFVATGTKAHLCSRAWAIMHDQPLTP